MYIVPASRVPCLTGPEDGTGGAKRDACTALYGPSDDIGVVWLGPPEEISIWCTTQEGTSPECQIATLGLWFDGVQHATTSYLKATLSTVSHPIASGPGELWQ